MPARTTASRLSVGRFDPGQRLDMPEMIFNLASQGARFMDGTLDHAPARCLAPRSRLREACLGVFLLGLLFILSSGGAWACVGGEVKASAGSIASSIAVMEKQVGAGAVEDALLQKSPSSGFFAASAPSATAVTSGHCCSGSGVGPCASFHCAACALAGLPVEFFQFARHTREVLTPAAQLDLTSTGWTPDLRPPVSC